MGGSELSGTPQGAEVFKANLRRLAAAHKMEFDELASALGFIRGKKKWLRRAWEDGLTRCDKRTLSSLKKVTKRLGLSDVSDLWKPDVPLDPAQVWNVNFLAWKNLVEAVKNYLETLPTLRTRYPREMWEIESKYQFDEVAMVAHWTARDYRSISGDVDEVELLNQLIAETEATRKYLQETRLRERIWQRIQETSEWKAMLHHLFQLFDEDEFHYPQVAEVLAERLTDAITRFPADEEVFARYFDRYLAPYSENSHHPKEEENESDTIDSLLDELRTHRHWQHHLELKFRGDEDKAKLEVTRLWRLYKESSSGMALTDVFVTFYRQRVLENVYGREDAERRRRK